MNFLAFTGLINFATSASLAVLVFKKCPRRDVAIAYSVLNAIIAVYSGFYFLWQCASTPDAAILQLRLLTISAVWINQALLYFNIVFFGITNLRKRISWLAVPVNLMFSILHFTPKMYSSVVTQGSLGFWPPRVSGWFALYVVWWHAELMFAFGDLLYSRNKLEGHKRNQATYMIVAFAIGYAGGITNWPMWFGVHLPPYANFLISVYTLIVGYAMIRHQLMDISFVIRKTLVYSLVTALLALVYLSIVLGLAWISQKVLHVSSGVSYAAAAGAITLLFHPLRMRVQRLIDRYFFRESLDQSILREATSGFVHEIKRPLANISLPAELAMMDLQEVYDKKRPFEEVFPKIMQRLEYIIDQSRDAGHKIEAIREFSSSSGAPLEEVRLSDIIQKSVAVEKSLLNRHQVSIQLDIPENLPILQGRPKQLEIVFTNLIKNAAEAMAKSDQKAERSIWIKADATPQTITVSVKDSGPGILKENLPHLFEPYFTTKGSHGMGMGLYLCRQIVQSHGGTILVKSEKDRGTSFEIQFRVHTLGDLR